MENKPDSKDDWKSSWSKTASYLDNISRYDPDWHRSKVRIKKETYQS
jgi:hypothetical protein